MTNAVYPCAQSELYPACNLGWTSCEQHVADFAAFSPRYDAALIALMRTAISAAEDLPDDQARNANTEILRLQLAAKSKLCTDKWQRIKRYTAKAFSEAEQKPKLEEAGSKNYTAASNNNWDKVRALNNSGLAYLTNNQVALELDNNMPTTFIADYTTEKDAFEALHQDFLDSEETSKQGTQGKVEANNRIYNDLIEMCLDGQEIFKGNEAVKAQFVFKDILRLVSGAKAAGIKGLITSASDGVGVPDAQIQLISGIKIAKSDASGRYELKPIASGTYSIEVSAAGYVTQLIEDVVIRVGQVSTLDIILVVA